MKYIFLLLLLTLLTVITCSTYENNGFEMSWTDDDQLIMNIPDDWDCSAGCADKNADRCVVSFCFELCYDTNKDFYVSKKELTNALDNNLSFIERMVTYKPSEWVSKFDGEDGSIKDKKISPIELYKSSQITCNDVSDVRTKLCNKCPLFLKQFNQ